MKLPLYAIFKLQSILSFLPAVKKLGVKQIKNKWSFNSKSNQQDISRWGGKPHLHPMFVDNLFHPEWTFHPVSSSRYYF